MCFEFEYLYWAKLEEEARQRKAEEEETARQELAQGRRPLEPQSEQRQPIPV